MSLRAAAVAEATKDGVADPAAEQQKLLTQLTNLIPAEALAAFVALIAATANYSYKTRLWMFWIVLAFTPLWVITNYLLAATGVGLTDLRKWPWFTAFVGTVAFILWSVTVPKSPFEEHLLFFSDKGISAQTGAAVTIAGSILLGFLTGGLRPAWQRVRAASKKNPDPPPPDPPPPAPPA